MNLRNLIPYTLLLAACGGSGGSSEPSANEIDMRNTTLRFSRNPAVYDGNGELEVTVGPMPAQPAQLEACLHIVPSGEGVSGSPADCVTTTAGATETLTARLAPLNFRKISQALQSGVSGDACIEVTDPSGVMKPGYKCEPFNTVDTDMCGDSPDSDNDGVCDLVDPCPNDAEDLCTDPCNAYGGDSDGDNVCDDADPCPYDATDSCGGEELEVGVDLEELVFNGVPNGTAYVQSRVGGKTYKFEVLDASVPIDIFNEGTGSFASRTPLSSNTYSMSVKVVEYDGNNKTGREATLSFTQDVNNTANYTLIVYKDSNGQTQEREILLNDSVKNEMIAGFVPNDYVGLFEMNKTANPAQLEAAMQAYCNQSAKDWEENDRFNKGSPTNHAAYAQFNEELCDNGAPVNLVQFEIEEF